VNQQIKERGNNPISDELAQNTSLMHIKSSYRIEAGQKRCTSRDVHERERCHSNISKGSSPLLVVMKRSTPESAKPDAGHDADK
jgi:hypothetical protein